MPPTTSKPAPCPAQRLLLAALALAAPLGCASDADSPIHFPRPALRAGPAAVPDLSGRAATTDDNARIDILAANPTEAPLWLRRLTMRLEAEGETIAAGEWAGDRQIDPGTSLLLEVSLPMAAGAPTPGPGTRATLNVRAHYARSGVIGLLGGETHTYDLPLTIAQPQ